MTLLVVWALAKAYVQYNPPDPVPIEMKVKMVKGWPLWTLGRALPRKVELFTPTRLGRLIWSNFLCKNPSI